MSIRQAASTVPRFRVRWRPDKKLPNEPPGIFRNHLDNDSDDRCFFLAKEKATSGYMNRVFSLIAE